MAGETHKVECPMCGLDVEASLVREDWKKRYYKCPNADKDGVPHTFGVLKMRWKIAKGALTILPIVLGVMSANKPNNNKWNQGNKKLY